MGYLIMTLLAVKTESGRFALAFYLMVYAAMDLGAFGIIASLSHEKEDRDALEAYQCLGYASLAFRHPHHLPALPRGVSADSRVSGKGNSF